MSIHRPKIDPKNIILIDKYWRFINNKKLYLFILGLTLSVGDLKLILATSIFAGSMLFAYQIKNISWKDYKYYFSQVLTPHNKQLIISVSSAGTLAIITYFIANLWSEIDNKWLALGIIWQITFSTIGIGFLSYKLWIKDFNKKQYCSSKFEKLIHQLNSDSSLQRLSSINELIKFWKNNELSIEQINEVKEYFILLRDLEIEPLIIHRLNYYLEKMSEIRQKPLNLPQKKYIYSMNKILEKEIQ